MEQLADNVFVETQFEGVNVGAIITAEGIICIDVPSYPRDTRRWLAQLQQLSYQPIKFIILTDCHGDRILNSRWLNAPIIMQQMAARQLRSYDRRYPQTLIDSLVSRNPVNGRELSSHPVDRPRLSFNYNMRLALGETELLLLHAPGPTEGNAWVYLPSHKIIFTGDCVVNNSHPRLTEASSQKWLDSLERLERFEYPIDQLVPGRGEIGTKADLNQVKAYVRQAREYMQDCLLRGEPNGGTAVYVQNLLAAFPSNHSTLEWTQQQIEIGLEHLYDEIKLAQENNILSA